MVGAGGIEPPTPTVSRWCSPTELRANRSLDAAAPAAAPRPEAMRPDERAAKRSEAHAPGQDERLAK